MRRIPSARFLKSLCYISHIHFFRTFIDVTSLGPGRRPEQWRSDINIGSDLISLLRLIAPEISELVSPAFGIAIQDEIAFNDALFVQPLNRSKYHSILWIKSYTKRSRETGVLSMLEP
jgi:hypothetical protein